MLFCFLMLKFNISIILGGLCRKKAQNETFMKVKIIPGFRNEEMIAEINQALETLEDDALEEYLDEKVCEGEGWFDSMYYAIEERGNSILASWEEYLLERLMTDEKYYFAADIGDYDF